VIWALYLKINELDSTDRQSSFSVINLCPMSKNAFEAGTRKVIPAVLVYVCRKDKILMIHRNSPGNADYHAGKWNGLGGKCEADESFLETARREVFEESGLELSENSLKGIGFLQFPNFKPHKNEDWLVSVFIAESQQGEAHPSSPEGDLHWIPTKDILSLNLWPGDRYFIPYVIQAKPFMGTIWYEGQDVVRYWIQEFR
jgi:8-oxo-dGTP diphosphatase